MLRENIFELSSGKTEVKPNEHGIYAFVMESTDQFGTSTLVMVADGAVSLYLSNGNAVIGCGFHGKIKTAAADIMNFLKKAAPYFQPIASHSLPDVGVTYFYTISNEGSFSAGSLTEDLTYKDHPLHLYFLMSQIVITEIRKLAMQTNTQ